MVGQLGFMRPKVRSPGYAHERTRGRVYIRARSRSHTTEPTDVLRGTRDSPRNGVPVSQIPSVKRGRVYESNMRIRTDGDNAHRKDTIEAAADRLDCNKTHAVLVSCNVVGEILDNVEDALENPDLPPRVRQELAETIQTRKVTIEVSEPTTSVQVD
jgi:hypothetical protein